MKIEKEYLDEEEILKHGEVVVPFKSGKRLVFVPDDETGELCAFFQKGPKERCLFVRKVTDEGKKPTDRIWLSNEKTAKATKNSAYITNAELLDTVGEGYAARVKEYLALPQFTRQTGKVQARLDALKARNLPKAEQKKEEVEAVSKQRIVDYNGAGRPITTPVRQRVYGQAVVQHNPVGFVDGAKPRVVEQLNSILYGLSKQREKKGITKDTLSEKEVELVASQAVRAVIAATTNDDERHVLSANISLLTKFAEDKLRGEKEKPAAAEKKDIAVEKIVAPVISALEDDFSLEFTAKTGKFGEVSYYTLDGKGEYHLPLGDVKEDKKNAIGIVGKKAGTRIVSIGDIKKVDGVYLKLGLIDAYAEAVVADVINSQKSKRKSSWSPKEREYFVNQVKEALQAKTITNDNADVLRADAKTKEDFERPEWVYRRDIERIVKEVAGSNNYEDRTRAAENLAVSYLAKNKKLKSKAQETWEKQSEDVKIVKGWRDFFLREAQKLSPVPETAIGRVVPENNNPTLSEEEKAKRAQEAKDIAGAIGGKRQPTDEWQKSTDDWIKKQQEKEKADKEAGEKKAKEEQEKREREAKEQAKKDKRAKRKATVKKILKKPITWIALAAVTVLAAGELTLGLWSKPDQTKEAKEQAKQLAGETKMESTVGEDFDLQNFKITDAKGREIVTSYTQKPSIIGHLRPAKQNYDEVEMEAYFTELGARAAFSVVSKANLKGEDGEITVPFVTESGKTTQAEFKSDLTKLGYSPDEIATATELYKDAFTKTYNENYNAKNFEKEPGNQDGPGTQGQDTKIDLKGETAKAIYESAIETYDPNFDIENAIVDGEKVYATGTGSMLDGTAVDLLYTLTIPGLGTESVDSEQELRDAAAGLDARTIGDTRAVGADYYFDRQQGHYEGDIDDFRKEVSTEYYVSAKGTKDTVSAKGTPGVKVVLQKIDGDKVETVDCGTIYGEKGTTNREGMIACAVLKDAWGNTYMNPEFVVVDDEAVKGTGSTSKDRDIVNIK